MKYFHRTHLSSDEILEQAAQFFGEFLAPAGEERRRRHFAGSIGRISVSAQAEGGHYTVATVETNQVGESEADKLAKRFLTLVHTRAEPGHRPIGAY